MSHRLYGPKLGEESSSRQWLILALSFVVAVWLWHSWLVFPIKLFVVLLHELSHGLAALLVGGTIVSLEVDTRLGGSCLYLVPAGTLRRLLVTSAGYLGSMVGGGLLLWWTCRSRHPRVITLVIGLLMAFPGLLFLKSGEWFGLLFVTGFGGGLLLAWRYLPEGFHGYLLKFLALTSCLYVIVDIKEDLIDRTIAGSDADVIASLTGIPAVLVGLAWALIALAVLGIVLRLCLKSRRWRGDIESATRPDRFQEISKNE
ncbi:MAG: M50 family metallopeptidase [Acidobacteria bacterium]|nr:M50 family metallopeptidase [Acidobacteriota bacterium]